MGLEGVVPPPVGAFAEGAGVGRDGGWGVCVWVCEWSGVEWLAVAVGDAQCVGGSGGGDVALVVQAVVVGADEDQVVQFGGSAVFPVAQVVGV